jgi:hypothetical protein
MDEEQLQAIKVITKFVLTLGLGIGFGLYAIWQVVRWFKEIRAPKPPPLPPDDLSE